MWGEYFWKFREIERNLQITSRYAVCTVPVLNNQPLLDVNPLFPETKSGISLVFFYINSRTGCVMAADDRVFRNVAWPGAAQS